MADPTKIIRLDGTRVTTPRNPSWKTEFLGLWITFKQDPYVLLLFPMFLASNWFYTWRKFNKTIDNDAIYQLVQNLMNTTTPCSTSELVL